MTQDMIMGVMRALLSAVGGALVAKGIVDEGTSQALIGALMTIGTGVWSIAAKKKA